MKITVGSVVTAKLGYMAEKVREVISGNIREQMMGCVHAVEGKNNFRTQFIDGKSKDMTTGKLMARLGEK